MTAARDPALPHISWGRNRYLEVDGERVHVVERGTIGERLLLVHGYASHSLAWRPVMDRLDGRFQMAAVDMPGFGWSARVATRPLTGEAYGERLARILAALGWPRAHVAGISWGGGLAQRLAAAHPDMVDRLALVATVDPSRPLWLGTVGLRMAIRFPRLARIVVARALRAAARKGGVPAGELARGYVDPLLLPGTAAFLSRFVAEHAGSELLDLSRIVAPTLVIGPLEDHVVDPAVTRSVAERISGARYEAIPGARHSVAFESPDRVASLIAEFLRSVALADEASLAPRLPA